MHAVLRTFFCFCFQLLFFSSLVILLINDSSFCLIFCCTPSWNDLSALLATVSITLASSSAEMLNKRAEREKTFS